MKTSDNERTGWRTPLFRAKARQRDRGRAGGRRFRLTVLVPGGTRRKTPSRRRGKCATDVRRFRRAHNAADVTGCPKRTHWPCAQPPPWPRRNDKESPIKTQINARVRSSIRRDTSPMIITIGTGVRGGRRTTIDNSFPKRDAISDDGFHRFEVFVFQSPPLADSPFSRIEKVGAFHRNEPLNDYQIRIFFFFNF